MKIGKYSFGTGDRFAHEGVNQLKALIEAEKLFGVHFVPVWNKSNREHNIIGTEPASTRQEADAAVKAVFDAIEAALVEGEKVSIVGFGSFETKVRAAHEARNPATGEKVQVPETRSASFKAGRTLKEKLG